MSGESESRYFFLFELSILNVINSLDVKFVTVTFRRIEKSACTEGYFRLKFSFNGSANEV